ncbi:hypothetical protein LTR49_013228 [Elasticomyces elasticus]|nr:hypothetical protein LTR49_013228 [Elasticomyces elasticus]
MICTTPSPNAARGKTFLDLPPEIRNAIYTLTLGRESYYRLKPRVHGETGQEYMVMLPPMPDIVNTRQQITAEVLSLFYSSQVFYFLIPVHQKLFSTTRGLVAKKHMTPISLRGSVAADVDDFFELEVLTAKGKLVTVRLNMQWQCTCHLIEGIRDGATRKFEERGSEMGLAYAAVEHFCEGPLSHLQRSVSKAAVDKCCGCGKKRYEYEVVESQGEALSVKLAKLRQRLGPWG